MHPRRSPSTCAYSLFKDTILVATLLLLLSASGAVHAATGTIRDVQHVVIFMQENRSFDHYFGTMAGVRGYGDTNALKFQNGNSDFYQPTGSSYVLPFHVTTPFLADIAHDWSSGHSAWDSGKWDNWVSAKGSDTMTYYTRADLPYYYALADAYTICDDYFCSVVGPTNPNRLYMFTGMIDPEGTGGGPVTDNTEPSKGFTWMTYPEMLQNAGVTWKVYQEADNYDDNALNWFASFLHVTAGNPLYDRGIADVSDIATAFQADVTSGNLPTVSYIIAPASASEHPPYAPANGAVLTTKFINAIASNPTIAASTVFLLTYDENDGLFDHIPPPTPPAGTPDEFVNGKPIGLGTRVPMVIVSPWSRGGHVCSQVFDHTSIIRFLELVTGVVDPNISAWRRQVCGDLTSAFDFANPDYTVPTLPTVTSVTGSGSVTQPVPSPQALPTQETGTKLARPLPYQPFATSTTTTASGLFSIAMWNAGASSVHYSVYANAYRTDGPWQYDAGPGGITGDSWNVVTSGAGNYDLTCYGPNGFQQRFAGNINVDLNQIEVTPLIPTGGNAITLAMRNSSSASVTFTVTDTYSGTGSVAYPVPANSTVSHTFPVTSGNQGWYGLSVTASSDSVFLRTFNGHLETGFPSDDLQTYSSGALAAVGIAGGPFAPGTVSYQLINGGSAVVSWTAHASQNWLTLSATSGTLTVGASGTVTVSLNSSANSLAPGTYSDTIVFTNLANSHTQSWPVSLTVQTNGVWINPAGGSWTSGANWAVGVAPQGVGTTADFSTLSLPADAAVTLDGARTIGNLIFGDTAAGHNWTLNTGTGGPLTLSVTSGTPTVTVNNQAATIGAALAGTQGLAKSGAGTLYLPGGNTYTGSTSVNAGVLGAGPVTVTSTNVLTIAAGATVNSTGKLQTTANSSGVFPAVGGAGTLALRSTTSSPTSPDIYFNSNDTANSTSNWGSIIATAVDLGASQRYVWGNTNHNSVSKYLTSAGADTNFTGPISGTGGLTFIAQNNNTGSTPMEVPFVLSGSNTFTGMLEIQRGSVYLNNTNALVQGNVLLLDPASGNNARLFLYGNNALVSNLSSNGAGTAVIANGNTATSAPVTLGKGTLTVNQTTAGTYAGTLVDELAEYNGSGSKLQGPLALTKTGPAALTLSGVNTHTGGTTVNAGTLFVTGSAASSATSIGSGGMLGGTGTLGAVTVASGGTLAPGVGGIGTLTLSSAALSLSGTTAMELNKAAGTSDSVQGISTATYGGTLTVTNLGGTLAAGDSFTLFSASMYAGSFSNITLPSLPTGLAWNTANLGVNGTINVVSQVLTSIQITPSAASLGSHATQTFAAVAYDQFGSAMAVQPAIVWSSSGAGNVSASGVYTASYATSSANVTASAGGKSGSANVTVTNAAPSVATAASATSATVNGSTTNISVLGADTDGGGESNLTYTWTATTVPSGVISPTYSANGTNAAKNAMVTFFKSGAYVLKATITDNGGLSVTSSVSINVTLTPFGNWKVQKFGANAGNAAIAGPTADPDADGISNLLEYALNTDPMNAASLSLPTVGMTGGTMTFTYRKNDAASDLSYVVQQSSDLLSWTAANVVNTILSDDGSTSVIQASIPVGASTKLWLRLSVTMP